MGTGFRKKRLARGEARRGIVNQFRDAGLEPPGKAELDAQVELAMKFGTIGELKVVGHADTPEEADREVERRKTAARKNPGVVLANDEVDPGRH